jgi:hypothetical protein
MHGTGTTKKEINWVTWHRHNCAPAPAALRAHPERWSVAAFARKPQINPHERTPPAIHPPRGSSPIKPNQACSRNSMPQTHPTNPTAWPNGGPISQVVKFSHLTPHHSITPTLHLPSPPRPCMESAIRNPQSENPQFPRPAWQFMNHFRQNLATFGH